MSIYTKDDILRMVKEQDVKFICLQFTDILGMLKSVSITASQLDKALDSIREKYGMDAIQRASVISHQDDKKWKKFK